MRNELSSSEFSYKNDEGPGGIAFSMPSSLVCLAHNIAILEAKRAPWLLLAPFGGK